MRRGKTVVIEEDHENDDFMLVVSEGAFNIAGVFVGHEGIDRAIGEVELSDLIPLFGFRGRT